MRIYILFCSLLCVGCVSTVDLATGTESETSTGSLTGDLLPQDDLQEGRLPKLLLALYENSCDNSEEGVTYNEGCGR